MELESKFYLNKPIRVEGAYYDGSEECAEAFCVRWPKDFLIGMSSDGNLTGLFISTEAGAIAVCPGDIVYRDVRDGSFCCIDEGAFFRYFDEEKAEVQKGEGTD